MPRASDPQITIPIYKDNTFFDPSGRKQHISLVGFEQGPEQVFETTTGAQIREDIGAVDTTETIRLTRFRTTERGYLWVRPQDIQTLLDRINGV